MMLNGVKLKNGDLLVRNSYYPIIESKITRKCLFRFEEYKGEYYLYSNIEAFWGDSTKYISLNSDYPNCHNEYTRYINLPLVNIQTYYTPYMKCYPNSSLYKTLYPNGQEDGNFWKVLQCEN